MLGILWLSALSLVGLILVNAFTRRYSVPADGVLTSPEARIVRAAKAGTVLAVAARPGTPLRPNQLLVTLQGADERVQGIGSPCPRSEEHTSEFQSLMRTSYAVFCLKKKNNIHYIDIHTPRART